MEFQLPPRLRNANGKTRQVGFEIEFGGVSLPETCSLIQGLFGGEIEQKNAFAYRNVGTSQGDFEVESDARFLSQKRYEKYLGQIGLTSPAIVEAVEKILEESVAGTLLPFEIAMPPLPMDHLKPADQIREALFLASARGAHSSVFAAFGCQMNPEVPDTDVRTLLSTLRAFFLLEERLKELTRITIARQVAPYIHPFPAGYVDLVLDVDYRPDLKTFMIDYLEWNPTRNRPLDLLPLLAYIDHELVFSYPVEKDMVKPRPTYHYRLPNSEIDDPDWSLACEWNRWVQIERLADREDQLLALCETYTRLREESLIFPKDEWILMTRNWVDERARP